MEYFALIIPLIAIAIGLLFFKERFTWWELIFPLCLSILVIVVSKFCIKTALVSDTEYWGSLVTKARYYEYWETWVHQICSYECNCTTDKDGNESCQTCYYDCSYCDENSAHWVAYDDAGNNWGISEEYYHYLKDKWAAKPEFVELNRNIDYSSGCGKDGNAYEIEWNGQVMSSEAAVTEHTYTNRVQASHSAFRLPYISRSVAKQRGLYDYPKYYNEYKQKVILGLDSIYSSSKVDSTETLFQYFNGHYGHLNKVKLFVLLFYDKPQSISFDQEAYWDGGNQNELVVCIGLNRTTQNIQWVRPFSWTDRKRVLIDCREDIAQLGKFDSQKMYDAIENAVATNDIHKNFKKDFSYLTIDLPTWALVLIWILTFFASGGMFWWGLDNEFENQGKFDIVDWVTIRYDKVHRWFRKI